MAFNIRRSIKKIFCASANKEETVQRESQAREDVVHGFGTVLNTANSAFDSYVQDLRTDFLNDLEYVIKEKKNEQAKDAELKTLQTLQKAISTKNSKQLYFRYEATKPANNDLITPQNNFAEALFTLTDKNHELVPIHQVFNSLDNKQATCTPLGAKFRLLLCMRQIQDFSHNAPKRLSINILPNDIDSEWFYTRLNKGMNLLNEKHKNWEWTNQSRLILEAVESDDWTYERLGRMKALQQTTGANLAVDDYGSGYNQKPLLDRLKILNNNSPDDALIIKIDGEVIRDFLDTENINEQTPLIKCLQDIKDTHKNATVVMEWIRSGEEAAKIKKALKPFGLDDYVQLVQSRDLKDVTKQEFLNNVERNLGQTPPPVTPPPAKPLSP